MVVSICIGSSCHLKGSREVVSRLSELVKEHGLTDKVELIGSFCSGQCQKDVCIHIDNHGDQEIFSVKAEDTQAFFEKEILGRIKD